MVQGISMSILVAYLLLLEAYRQKTKIHYDAYKNKMERTRSQRSHKTLSFLLFIKTFFLGKEGFRKKSKDA